jgi:hypothetical protein
MATIMPSGSYYCYKKSCGIFFWGANGHDAVWHLALASTAFKAYPFISPIYSGAVLTGYNYLMDLVFYLLSRVGISASFSYFKLFPLLWFFLLTSLTVMLGRKIKDAWQFVAFLLFFMYFGSSFTFLFPLFHNGTIWGASSLLSMQSGQALTNMQFALSLIVLLIILLLMQDKNKEMRKTLLFGFLIFINVGLKIYAGIISFFAISLYFILAHLEMKQLILNIIIISIFFLGAIFLFFNPLTSLKSGSVFIFSPFATMHSLIEEPNLLYLKDMVNARYYLYAHGGLLKSPRLWSIELFSSALFLFFSLGLRMFGLVYFVIKLIKRTLSRFDIVIVSSALFAYLLLILFVQKGQWWNVIQFYYFALFLLNIITAEFFYEVIKTSKKKVYALSIITLLIILTLPGNLDIARGFFRFPGHSYISQEEITALNFLKNQPEGVVFTQLFDKKNKITSADPVTPIYIGEDSAYVSAYSGKPLYLADIQVLQITGINYESRLKRIQDDDCSILNEVGYIYQVKEYQDKFLQTCLPMDKDYNVRKIFENKGVAIYSVRLSK